MAAIKPGVLHTSDARLEKCSRLSVPSRYFENADNATSHSINCAKA